MNKNVYETIQSLRTQYNINCLKQVLQILVVNHFKDLKPYKKYYQIFKVHLYISKIQKEKKNHQ